MEHRVEYNMDTNTYYCVSNVYKLDCGSCEICATLHCEAENAGSQPPDFFAWEKWSLHWASCKKRRPGVKKEGNGKYLGKWAFTLTCSPSDGLTKDDLLKAVNKIMNQRSQQVKSYAWYFEHKGIDDDGNYQHPHIHGMYELDSGGRIEAKHWKRAWPIWDEKKRLGQGFRGGYHRPVRSDEDYSDYIAKDGLEGENNLLS